MTCSTMKKIEKPGGKVNHPSRSQEMQVNLKTEKQRDVNVDKIFINQDLFM